MVRRAVEHRDLSYFGNPEAVREYIHVDDAAVAAVQILSEEFRNLQIVLSGQQAIQVSEVLGMIAEIIGIDKTGMRFEVTNDPGHYVRTPYSYRPSIAKKLIPKLSVDLGQGLVELIRDVQSEVDAAI
jgi:UDP-glucose 4-epimerase